MALLKIFYVISYSFQFSVTIFMYGIYVSEYTKLFNSVRIPISEVSVGLVPPLTVSALFAHKYQFSWVFQFSW